MVKILGICGSPRKRSAYSALEAALEAAKNSGEEVETELIELRGKKINPCIHCNNCLKKNMDRCTVYEDDMGGVSLATFLKKAVRITPPFLRRFRVKC